MGDGARQGAAGEPTYHLGATKGVAVGRRRLQLKGWQASSPLSSHRGVVAGPAVQLKPKPAAGTARARQRTSRLLRSEEDVGRGRSRRGICCASLWFEVLRAPAQCPCCRLCLTTPVVTHPAARSLVQAASVVLPAVERPGAALGHAQEGAGGGQVDRVRPHLAIVLCRRGERKMQARETKGQEGRAAFEAQLCWLASGVGSSRGCPTAANAQHSQHPARKAVAAS